ncbi:PIN domain-containing protein [bacterium]|nr:PIN domain-containing protein [bacterium]
MIVSTFTAVFDACVFYPAPLRDLLMQLALTGLFRARWTDRIHEEWIAALLERRPDLRRERLLRTRGLIDSSAPDCLVTGYEHLMEGLELPDPDDRHVLAAAIRCNAAVIVSFNQSDFPAGYLAEFGIEVQHPDEFIGHLIDLAPDRVFLAAKKVRARLKNPPRSADEYLETLAAQGLPETVTTLRRYRDLI